MLKISEIEKDDWVIYRPYPGAQAEDGRVTKVGETLVHVLYKGDTTAKATHPKDLEFGCPSAHDLEEEAADDLHYSGLDRSFDDRGMSL